MTSANRIHSLHYVIYEKRIWLFLVILAILFFAQSALADTDTPVELEVPDEKMIFSTENLDDNQQLAVDYLNRIMPSKLRGRKRAGASQGARLTGTEATVYNLLRNDIAAIANGDRSSAILSYDVENAYGKSEFTMQDLGIKAILDDDGFTKEAISAINSIIFFDMEKVLSALLLDCPYELYWYDKTTGFLYEYPNDVTSDGTTVTVSGNVVVYLSVAAEYALNGDGYLCDPAFGQGARAAAAAAQAIVNQYAQATDEEKLTGYAQEICSLTDYNYDALGENVPYGNPWQLIWVFDGNPDTTVVCEGYAKAFQYLCDLTEFTGDISVITVTGTMDGGTGAGNHMWNVVQLDDGNNLLVDVTNIDEGTSGYPDQLLLAKYSYGDFQSGYTIVTTNGSVRYIYDENTKSIYSQAEIELYSDLIVQSVAINEENFPDEIFRAYVQSNFDADGNNVLSEMECADVTSIYIQDMNISSLEGIRFFPNLIDLLAMNNSIEELDLQYNLSLGYVHLFNNRISELDVSKLINLKALTLDFNPISSIDISNNQELNALYASETKISTLDTSHNPDLEYLECQSTEITELDVSHNPKLIQLICQSIHLSSIDLSNNAELKSLWISDTDITDLDLSHNTKLTELFCGNNPLKALDLSNNPLISDLRADGICSILLPDDQTTIDTALFDGFDKARASNWIGCSFDQQTGIISNITGNIIRYDYDCGHNLSVEITLYRTGCVALNETNFPDPIFREYIRNLFEADEYLTPEQLISPISIDVTGAGITTLKGIELFPNLINLWCGNNPVAELNISSHSLCNLSFPLTRIKELFIGNQPSLSWINASDSALESFNGKYYPSLTHLYLDNTRISTLDLSDCPNLTLLYCDSTDIRILENGQNLEWLSIAGTKITEIDLNQFKKLLYFNCSYTDIGELKNLQGCTGLQTLHCMGTKITELNVSALSELNNLMCEFSCINELELENTALETISVSPQKLNRFVLAEKHGDHYTIDISGIVSQMDRISFPDDYNYDEDAAILTFENLENDQIIYYYDTHFQSEKLEVRCDVLIINDELDLTSYNTLYLPGSVSIIEEGAFEGINVEVVVIPERCIRVEARAFASCCNLRTVIVRSGQTIIEENAFGNQKPQVIILSKDSQ